MTQDNKQSKKQIYRQHTHYKLPNYHTVLSTFNLVIYSKHMLTEAVKYYIIYIYVYYITYWHIILNTILNISLQNMDLTVSCVNVA